MGNFFKSLFSSSKAATPEEEKSKNDQKNFDILKYDGVRAQKIGQVAYAIKCFTGALKLQEDFETMTYLVAAYTTANKAEEALEVLNRMVELEPDHINTLLTRVNVLFMLDKAKGRHQWMIEFEKMPPSLDDFASLLDKTLQQLNSDYEAKRYKEISLQPLEIRVAREGTFYEWLRRKGKLGGQHKIPRLSNDRTFIEELGKICDS